MSAAGYRKYPKPDYGNKVYAIDGLPYLGRDNTYEYFAIGEKGARSIGGKMVRDVIDAYCGENEDGGLERGGGNSPRNQLPE